MSQFYTDPKRESDPYAMPNGEVFHRDNGDYCYCDFCGALVSVEEDEQITRLAIAAEKDADEYPTCKYCDKGNVEPMGEGWYYWYCLPGCLPDSEPNGPFGSEELAIEDARQYNESEDDEDEDKPDMRCDQCEAAMINGAYCHETGCPNSRKVKIDGEWVTPESDNDEESDNE